MALEPVTGPGDILFYYYDYSYKTAIKVRQKGVLLSIVANE